MSKVQNVINRWCSRVTVEVKIKCDIARQNPETAVQKAMSNWPMEK